ncbi:MAG: bifunctional 2-polyprenyl-6-hydroxyphenol methylase/3-demethylubiquinol 3-O-methyltransferase UbiG [Hyphomicrobiaceae bacterium]
MRDRSESERRVLNLSRGQVDQFSRQASQWWDPAGPFRPLHQIGPTRLSYIRDVMIRHFDLKPGLRRPLRDLRILDVGCGGGLISEPLARLGASVCGIDPSEENIEVARLHATASRLTIDYQPSTVEEMSSVGIVYDAVVCLEVIEHVPDPGHFVAMLSGLVTPGGLLVMSTINRTAKSYLLAIVGAEYVLQWLPAGTHQWEQFVRPAELSEYVSQAGLSNFSSTGLVYNVLEDAWSLADDTGVNYMAHATRPA